jgi:ABC-type branched-subunit amino acid transport system substrate-binding protein
LPIRQITGSLAEDLEKALSAKGMKAVTVEKFNIKDVDMTPQLLKAKQAGAQAVLTYGIGPELAQIANGMEKLNWKVPMIGSWDLSMANFLDNAGKMEMARRCRKHLYRIRILQSAKHSSKHIKKHIR